ncbi:pyridoxal phosphate-dependent aminotransferase, partial [Pseudomonas aeruginosa]|nr:pyridoxal phosphate-dependent aminotransferase [Pseudomonas aeruginosa]
IAERHRRRSGQAVDAEQVVVLAGAQCALYAVVQCLLNPGDEVIVAEPMYVTYEAVFGACGARVVPVPVRSENGFRVQAEEVAALITPRTRAMALNSPHNPSGASLPRATWEALAELCMAHDLWMISDEVYSELLFDGEHVSPASLPGMADRTATLNSLSKSHAMTGWRVGWVVGPAALCAHLENLALCMLYGSPEFIQDAACTALEAPLPELEAMREAYRRRRDLVIECLADSPGLRPLRPDGGMFV